MFDGKQLLQNYYESSGYSKMIETPCEHGVSITIGGQVYAQEISSVKNEDLLFRDDFGNIMKFPNQKEAIRWIMNNVEDKDISSYTKNYFLKEGWQKQFMKK